MRTLKKEILITGLTMIIVGVLSSAAVVGAEKPRKSPRDAKRCGLYIKQDQKAFLLPQQSLTFKTALVLGSDQSGLYGIASPPQTILDLKPIEIVLFDPETAGATIRLAKLSHIDTAPAHSFDLQATKIGPTLFDKIYHVKYDESLSINLWCVDRDIPLEITPVAKKPGWFRAVPDRPAPRLCARGRSQAVLPEATPADDQLQHRGYLRGALRPIALLHGLRRAASGIARRTGRRRMPR